jgi:hypothetical protein
MTQFSASVLKRSASANAVAILQSDKKPVQFYEFDKEFCKQLAMACRVVETYQVVPWDDDDLWVLLLKAATQGSHAFVDGLEWFAFSSGGYSKPRDLGKEFVFHKSMTKEQRHIIHRISGELFASVTERTPTGDSILHVYVPKWLDR